MPSILISVYNRRIKRKHFYAGEQRIVSKVGDVASYGSDPRTLQVAGGASAAGITVDYQAKKAALEKVLAERFEELAVPYSGEDNDNYVEGDPKLKAGATAADGGADGTVWSQFEAGEYEGRQYFYHPDHLGSTGYVTDADGQVVQHVEYVPFGEVFIDRRATEWNSPYLFNAKELDEETGLYYYGARYYDPRISIWLSPDPLAEMTPGVSPYRFSRNNPMRFVDPLGLFDTEAEARGVADQKFPGAAVYRDTRSSAWFISLNKEGDAPYTSGLTVTRFFGPNNPYAIQTSYFNLMVSAFGTANGAKSELISYAVKESELVGTFGKYVKATRIAGAVSGGINIYYSAKSLIKYNNRGGKSNWVRAKYTTDIIMGFATVVATFVPVISPVVYPIATAYFLTDLGTDGFGLDYTVSEPIINKKDD